MIPQRLIRTVPEETTEQVEEWWEQAKELHPGWDFVTYRDPIDPSDFPLTRDAWPLAKNGAQLAGLVRLEALLNLGGFYLDSECSKMPHARSDEAVSEVRGRATPGELLEEDGPQGWLAVAMSGMREGVQRRHRGSAARMAGRVGCGQSGQDGCLLSRPPLAAVRDHRGGVRRHARIPRRSVRCLSRSRGGVGSRREAEGVRDRPRSSVLPGPLLVRGVHPWTPVLRVQLGKEADGQPRLAARQGRLDRVVR